MMRFKFIYLPCDNDHAFCVRMYDGFVLMKPFFIESLAYLIQGMKSYMGYLDLYSWLLLGSFLYFFFTMFKIEFVE